MVDGKTGWSPSRATWLIRWHWPLRPTYSRVTPVSPTWLPDYGCGLLPHIVWKFRPFISLQSASGRFRFLMPPSRTTCLSTHICAVTRGFQTTTRDISVFPFLPIHYRITRMLLLPFITTVWTPVVHAIINIIQDTLKCLWWWWSPILQPPARHQLKLQD